MALELPDTLHSPEQLKVCLFEMDNLLAWRRRQEIKRQTGATTQAAPDFTLSRELTSLLGTAEAATQLTAKELESYQIQLKQWLAQPVAHLTFAGLPPPTTKLAMVKWFREQISPTALVKFHVNSNIVGGMVIRTQSKVFDLSYRRQLLKQRNLIPELLKRA